MKSVTQSLDEWIKEDEWIEKHGSARDALNVALARLELAQSALREIEWVSVPGYYSCERECPWCLNQEHQGHLPECERQIALSPPAQNHSP